MVLRILEQWDALYNFFREAATEDHLIAASTIFNAVKNGIYKLYLTFLAYVLPLINKINIEFQGEKPKLHRVYTNIQTVYKTILSNFMQKNYIEGDCKGNTNTPEQTGPLLELNPMNVRQYLPIEKIHLGAEVEDLILTCLENQNKPQQDQQEMLMGYYVELCCQIKSRFKNLDEYKHFEVLDPKAVLSDDERSIVPLVRQFRHLTDNMADVGNTYRELSNLPKTVKMKFKDLPPEAFWSRIQELKDSDDNPLYKNLCDFVFNIFCLPHSSAAPERIFSQLNLIKIKTRNRLLPERCNDILLAKELLTLTNSKCYNWEPSQKLLNLNIKY